MWAAYTRGTKEFYVKWTAVSMRERERGGDAHVVCIYFIGREVIVRS